MKYREYTDQHPNEPCPGCKFFVFVTSHCTYKSKTFHCVRDEEYFKEMREKEADEMPSLF